MPLLLLDVLVDCLAHPGEAFGQGEAARLQQGHRMADVMKGLGEERHVARQGNAPGEATLDDRNRGQRLAMGAGFHGQLVEEGHVIAPN